MKRKISEWFSIQLAKNPGRIVLWSILLFNVIFLVVSAGVISAMSLSGTEHMGFLEAAFCTITMILDAGCIQFVINDIGEAGVAISLICLGIILIGMISFTGAVIGYVTNYISHFIESSSSGSRKMKLKNHIVILNWNTRASEIINDLVYMQKRQNVVVLTSLSKADVEKEISERLSDTVHRENDAVKQQAKKMKLPSRIAYLIGHKFKNTVTVVIREGDVFSSKQLDDISLKFAKSVIILGNDINNTVCKFQHYEQSEELKKGNPQTIKTLMQVSDITSADDSADGQKIIVEITDNWTADTVAKIIEWKQKEGKCNIVPVRVNKVLGQLLAQFSIMPELNLAYKELFSNKGAEFYSEHVDVGDEIAFNSEYLHTHSHSIPLAGMRSGEKPFYFFAANDEDDLKKETKVPDYPYTVSLNHDYWIENKYVIILGHNSKCHDIMEGFAGFRAEWGRNDSDEIIKIVVIDDERSLEKLNYYKDYPFVVETIAADIYDCQLICSTIEKYVAYNPGDTSVLILSDDSATSDNIDANSLTHLVYIQDIIDRKMKENPDFDPESIDVIVEIIDPKHYDVVSSYSTNNVVISNRYISKMIMQIGDKDALFEFYKDILSYDTDTTNGYVSKEVYVKEVANFFMEIPGECSAAELIRAVYAGSTDASLPQEKRNPAIVLGYVKPGGRMILFGGNQEAIKVKLEERDKLIVFSNH